MRVDINTNNFRGLSSHSPESSRFDVTSSYSTKGSIHIKICLHDQNSFHQKLHADKTADGAIDKTATHHYTPHPASNPFTGPLSKPLDYAKLADDAKALSDMSNTFEKLTDKLKSRNNMEILSDIETAADHMKLATNKLRENPTDQSAIRDFEIAVDRLNHGLRSVDGKIDRNLYNMLKGAVNDLDTAADKLKQVSQDNRFRDPGIRDCFRHVTINLDQVIDMADNLDSESLLPKYSGDCNYNSVPKPTALPVEPISNPGCDTAAWSVDRENRTVDLGDGYSLYFENQNAAWWLKDAQGNQTRIWGDPHVDENGDGKDDWHFKHDSTFVLDNGTKITVGTKDVGNALTVTDTLTITKDDQAVMVTGIADNRVRISDVMSNGQALDDVTNDGYVFHEGDGVDEWYKMQRVGDGSNEAMGGPRFHEESV